MFLSKKPRREVITLNVIPLIDISSMLIIFLIMGTIFGDSSVIIPSHLKLPKSESKDSVNNAPQVLITKDEVSIKFLNRTIETSAFDIGVTEKMVDLEKNISEYIKQIPAESRQGSVLLNVIADESVSYKMIFNVVKVFRRSGFESILFVTIGENAKK